MSRDDGKIIEFFGEGPADLGPDKEIGRPDKGVLPILTSTLCGRPAALIAKRKRYAHLMGKGLWQKVHFAKRQARYNGSDGAVFAVDSEGTAKDLAKKMAELCKGRDHALPDFPMAIGVAHPCIESWLLGDGEAIRRALKLPSTPVVPDEPESLPAPCNDRSNGKTQNPKAVLAAAGGAAKSGLKSSQMWSIAKELNDMGLVRTRCPLGFAPFADEVEQHIRPLF